MKSCVCCNEDCHEKAKELELKYALLSRIGEELATENARLKADAKTEQGGTPCNIPCSKCGSLDVRRQFREEKSSWREGEVPKNFEEGAYKFDPRTFRFAVLIERINHHCRCCGFEWETAPLSEPNVRSDPQHEEA